MTTESAPLGDGGPPGGASSSGDGQASDALRPRLGVSYWRLLSASTMTNLGDGLMAIAVVWLASSLTRDAMVLALIGLMTRIPWLVFSLPTGVITDRFDRRRLVGWMDVARAVVVGALALVVLVAGRDLPTPEELDAGAPAPDTATVLLVALALAALVLGFAEVVRDNAAQTLLPSIVDKRLLEKANGRMWGAELTMNQFVGPPLAGVLVAIAIVIPFAANAALLAVAAVLVLSLSGTFTPAGERTSGRIDWRREIGDGWRWLWRHDVLRTLAIALGVMNMASAFGAVVYVFYAQEILGLFDGWMFGVLLSGMAIGAVIGSFIADRVAGRLGDARSLLAAVLVMAVSYAAVGLLSHAVLVWVVTLTSGLAGVLWNVITVSMRQRIIPDHLLGRVNSVYRFFGWGTISIGTLLGGLIVVWVEPVLGREIALRAPFVTAGVLYLLVAVYVGRRLTAARLKAEGATAEEVPEPNHPRN